MNVFEFVFPIVAGQEAGEVIVAAGTAFSIGGDRFMTAGHCLKTAFEYKWTAVGMPRGEEWKFWDITEAEIDDDYDIGIFS